MSTVLKLMFMKCGAYIGMVFQRPNPLLSHLSDITFAHERVGVKDKKVLDEIVETSLKQALPFGIRSEMTYTV